VKTLFVHIGTHKTGTTSIQAYLSKHAALLLRRGLYVPAIGSVWEHSGHHNVAWGLRDDPRFKPELGGFNELLLALRTASVDRAVISAENLESGQYQFFALKREIFSLKQNREDKPGESEGGEQGIDCAKHIPELPANRSIGRPEFAHKEPKSKPH
jgi:hypothetical protein